MAGRAGTHAAADRRHAVIEVAKVFHHSQAGARIDLVLGSVSIYHS